MMLKLFSIPIEKHLKDSTAPSMAAYATDPVLRKLRQEVHDFEVSLSYTARVGQRTSTFILTHIQKTTYDESQTKKGTKPHFFNLIFSEFYT